LPLAAVWERDNTVAIYKRVVESNGKQIVRYYFHKTIEGVRYRILIKTARTLKQAEQAARQIQAEIHEGEYGRPKGLMTLRDFFDKKYLPWAKANKRSWKDDDSRSKPILAVFGNKQLREVTPKMIESYKTQRHNSITRRKERRTKATVNRELQLLSRIFSRAKVEKEWHSNPCSEVSLFKGEKKRKRWLRDDLEERERLLAVLEKGKPYLYRLVLLDLNTGLRRTEILSLKVEDVDFHLGKLRAKETKNGEERIIEMNNTARGILDLLVAEAKQHGWQYLFTNPKTGTRYKDVKRAFKAALKEAKISDFWFHDLRHTFGTVAGNDPDVSIPALAETMGHKNWKTTMQYTHATDEGKRRVVAAQEMNRSQTGHSKRKKVALKAVK
jgi:integrase